MFYSHTFLARKGPLGTVWCAAHLQHRLKKSHYTSTNIPSTVARIMHPEVPIALRMSGHLLLGVVRIYSKQVDYLYQDCNLVLVGINKSFTSLNVNLPEDETRAAFDSVTLPETFQLDAIDVEDDLNHGRPVDNHIKRQEEITIEDPIASTTDPHIPIAVNEDIQRPSSDLQDASGTGPRPMEEDSHPSVPDGSTATIGDPSLSHQAGFNEKVGGDSSHQSVPAIEIMRDHVHDIRVENAPISPPGLPDNGILRDTVRGIHADLPVFPDQRDDIIEPDRIIEEQVANSPIFKGMFGSEWPTPQSHQPQEPSFVASEKANENLDSHISRGHGSVELALRSSPPGNGSFELAVRPTPPVEQPRPRLRKRRRQFFDKSTVLTNKSMKAALEDSRDLIRKKRNCPYSNLDIWKLENRMKKDSIFLEPLLSGFSSDLRSIYGPQSISLKEHFVSSELVHQEAEVAQSPLLGDNIEMEIEHLHNNKGPATGNVTPQILPSPQQVPSPPMFMPSPSGRQEFNAATTTTGSQSDQLETTIGPEVWATPDLAGSTGLTNSDLETPATFSVEGQGVQNTALSDIPELVNSARDLSFLEEDDNTPAGFQGTPENVMRKQSGTPEFGTLSARTRAVAQYLKRQSSATPNSEHSSGSLNLNLILENKSRKICARMFYETLVLKDCALIDVHQEEPYGDINLKVTPRLLKEQ